jgi:DNA repair exonuclease SbcCD nuclease subunit
VGTLGVPYVYIRGNHDSATTAALIAAQPNAVVLDDSATTVAGLAVVGTPDPRFTPDKSTGDDEAGEDVLIQSGEELAELAGSSATPPAIALVHDPRQAGPLDGVAPVVLAGHTHERKVTELEEGTLLMVQGSTGGAGLRGLQGEYPEPLTCTVLYLDRSTGELRAYDEITLAGLGETEVTMQRTVLPPRVDEPGSDAADEGGEAPASPTG